MNDAETILKAVLNTNGVRKTIRADYTNDTLRGQGCATNTPDSCRSIREVIRGMNLPTPPTSSVDDDPSAETPARFPAAPSDPEPDTQEQVRRAQVARVKQFRGMCPSLYRQTDATHLPLDQRQGLEVKVRHVPNAGVLEVASFGGNGNESEQTGIVKASQDRTSRESNHW